MIKRNKLFMCMGLVGELLLAGQAQAAYIIDDFNTANLYDNPGTIPIESAQSAVGGVPDVVGEPIAGVLGGIREIGAAREDAGTGAGTLDAYVCSACGLYKHVQDPLITGNTFANWDGINDSQASSGLSADLTALGGAFEVDVASTNKAGGGLYVGVYDALGGVSESIVICL